MEFSGENREGKKAQLASRFDIVLQNEFAMEENLALVHQFLTEHFLNDLNDLTAEEIESYKKLVLKSTKH